MRYILVLQWPQTTETSYEDLLAREAALEARLREKHGRVDGHDSGAGEVNIFIDTDTPEAAFKAAAMILDAEPLWSEVRAAFRATESDHYEVLWRATLHHFAVK